MTERMQKLEKMLEREPGDVFLLYAMAMEHKKEGAYAEALKFLGDVIAKDSAYAVAYHQAGLTHELAGDIERAKQAYRDGIAAAMKKGDQHAAEEMTAALSMIE